MALTDIELRREATRLANRLASSGVIKGGPQRLTVGRDSPYGLYIVLAKLDDGGYLEIWSAEEAGYPEGLLWVGLSFSSEKDLYDALNKSKIDVSPANIALYEERGVSSSELEDILDTCIEKYKYAEEYYVGRYILEYSLEKAADYLAALIGQDTIKATKAELLLAAGQGRGLTTAQRKAVELRAMSVTGDWLKSEGYSFEDVSASKSFDLLASKNAEDWIVEVKGTTNSLSSIIITKNEVIEHNNKHPLNILAVVHNIVLKGDRASGGILTRFVSWKIDATLLEPICFSYRLSV